MIKISSGNVTWITCTIYRKMEFWVMDDLNAHWKRIYGSKATRELSWIQEVPQTSLDMIMQFHLPHTASIIDIGGGDSMLVDHLLEKGYSDITVLDICAESLERAKQRLGPKAAQVKWIVGDIREFSCSRYYDLWHDRAVFHFLIDDDDVKLYVDLVNKCADRLVIGSFSLAGPTKCSGLPVHQYSVGQLQVLFCKRFIPKEGIYADHITPAGVVQNFSFCSLEKKSKLR